MSKKTYYCNKPCKIIADLGDEAVIEILTSLVYGVDEIGYEECYNEYSKIIVDKKYLFENKIDIEAEFVAMSAKLEKEQRDANQKIREEKRKLDEEIKSLRAKRMLDAEKFEGFDTMFKYYDGTINYVVYNNKIAKLDEIVCGNEESNLASVSFRSGKNKGIQMYVGQYSDYSGNNYEAEGFETLSEAKEYLIKDLDKNIDDILEKENEYRIQEYISCFTQWNIKSDSLILLKNKQEEMEKERKEATRKRLQEELARL